MPGVDPSRAFLTGGGEMGASIRAYDWSASPLGRPEDWPQPLKTLVGVMLGSNQPMFVAWGPERTMLYDEPYVTVLANKHPALGQDFLEVWDEIRADLEPLVTRAYNGEPFHMDDIELLMTRKGYPEVTHGSYSYTPIHDETGGVAGFFCPCNEITQQVQAAARLREGEERLRLATENAEIGFWDVDQIHDLLTWPPRVKAMFGISPDVPVSMADFYAGLHPADRERTAEAYAAAVDPARRAFYDVEYRTVGAEDDMVRWVAAKGRGLFDQAGVCVRVVGTAIDITARKAVEEQLRTSEEFNRRVLQSSADCIKVLSLDGDFEFMSEGGMCVMEVDDFDAIRGACWPDFWLGAEYDKALAAIEEAKRGGVGRFQGFATTIKGNPRWWDVLVTSIRGAGGAPEKLLSVSRDITAGREAEERLRELNETLERQVTDRTIELRRFREIVEATTSPICAFDPEYRLIAFNKAHNDEFRRVNGFDTKLGDVFPDLFISEQRPVMRALMSRALAGEPFTVKEEFGRPELIVSGYAEAEGVGADMYRLTKPFRSVDLAASLAALP